MQNLPQKSIEELMEKGFITKIQANEIENHKQLNLFSLHVELLAMLSLSVLLFTSGFGTFVYKNIDNIGHVAILMVNFCLVLVCFYFSLKKAPLFSHLETRFESPFYDYLVLAGSILATIFIGYLQYQYFIFGNTFGMVSFFSACFCFMVAYYFDNKSVLSIALTALLAAIGISITPRNAFDNAVYNSPELVYSGLILGTVILGWVAFSFRQNLKKHFYFVFQTFAQHVLGICIIGGLLNDNWFWFIAVLAAFVCYFYHTSYDYKNTSIFVFTLIYGYIGFNMLLAKGTDFIYGDLFGLIVGLFPFYVGGSIILFINLVKKFKKEKNAPIS